MQSRSQLTSQLSFSDSELDNIDSYESDLSQHSHFFRHSTPLLLDSQHNSGGSPSPHTTTVGGPVTFTGGPDRLGLHCLSSEGNGSQYVNKDSLAHDLGFLATMPELCDVTFLVGTHQAPVCAVRAILAARSWWVCVCVCTRPCRLWGRDVGVWNKW